MKIFCTATLFFVFFISKGQVSNPAAAHQKNPVYFLDSVKMMTLPLFDPGKIDSIYISSGNDNTTDTHGKVFIKTKRPNDFHFLTITGIAASYKIDNSKPVIFMVDNDFLKEIKTFSIDSSYILSVQITNSSEFEYLKQSLPGLSIVKIITGTKENIDKQHQIRIRGTEITSGRNAKQVD